MNITKDLVVSIDYILTDMENKVIDSTDDSEPLAYLHGYNNIIPGLEQALEGKSVGDHLKITIPTEDAYGERDEELVFHVPLERFEGIDSVEPGMQFEAHTPDGLRELTVIEVAGNTVTVDGNHPLAGIDLTFDVTVRTIREASPEELEHGHAHDPSDACEDDT